MKAKAHYQSLGRLKVGQMNKIEQAYSDYLEQKKLAGETLFYKFEGIKLRLADNTFYTPDFMVVNQNGKIEMHEIKGFWIDDAKVKIKVAASQYPFKFIAVRVKAKKDGGGWEIEEF